MENFEVLNSILSTVTNAKALLGIGATVAIYTAGIALKAGPGRCVVLGLKSLFSFLPAKSVRKADIENVLAKISKLRGGKYLVVTGGKGFGKSCLIQTALHRHFGVVHINVFLLSVLLLLFVYVKLILFYHRWNLDKVRNPLLSRLKNSSPIFATIYGI